MVPILQTGHAPAAFKQLSVLGLLGSRRCLSRHSQGLDEDAQRSDACAGELLSHHEERYCLADLLPSCWSAVVILRPNLSSHMQGAHGVVASHPLRMRKALGTNPSGSMIKVLMRVEQRESWCTGKGNGGYHRFSQKGGIKEGCANHHLRKTPHDIKLVS